MMMISQERVEIVHVDRNEMSYLMSPMPQCLFEYLYLRIIIYSRYCYSSKIDFGQTFHLAYAYKENCFKQRKYTWAM